LCIRKRTSAFNWPRRTFGEFGQLWVGHVTKEGSYKEANAWWEAKEADLKAKADAEAEEDDPRLRRLKELGRRVDYCERHGLHEEVEDIKAEVREVAALPEGAQPCPPGAAPLLESAVMLGVDYISHELCHAISPGEHVWADRFERERRQPRGRTVGHYIDLYLEWRRKQVTAGSLRQASYFPIELHLNRFQP
jgi:hypothetical protein